MATKTTPLSVRISEEDAEFIASLSIENAVTPSEKIRALIREARSRRHQERGLATCIGIAKKGIEPILQKIREAELSQAKRSELLAAFGEWLTETLAYLCTLQTEGAETIDLNTVESGMAERIFRLFSLTARLGITREAPCYDTGLISKHMAPLFEILNIIQERISKEKDHEHRNH